MAGRIPTKEEIAAAIGDYLTKNPTINCKTQTAEDIEAGIFRLVDANGKEATVGPGWKCDVSAVREELGEILMATREAIESPKLPVSPSKGMNVPAKAQNGSNGAMTKPGMPVRDVQVAELTFDDIKTYICPTANDQEIMIFLKLCQARNLNPFLRESYLIKYDQTKPAQMVVGKDKFCKTAEEHPQFDGFRAGIIVGKGDEILEREGTFFRKGEELLGGWAEVSRKDRKIPFKQTVSLSEFNKGMANWKTMPATMIRKCALVQALRECFASDLAGCYDRSEMGLDPENEISEA